MGWRSAWSAATPPPRRRATEIVSRHRKCPGAASKISTAVRARFFCAPADPPCRPLFRAARKRRPTPTSCSGPPARALILNKIFRAQHERDQTADPRRSANGCGRRCAPGLCRPSTHTVHKSQAQTLARVTYDFEAGDSFCHGQLYTGLGGRDVQATSPCRGHSFPLSPPVPRHMPMDT